jgi:excisionase family DNA binding protein
VIRCGLPPIPGESRTNPKNPSESPNKTVKTGQAAETAKQATGANVTPTHFSPKRGTAAVARFRSPWNGTGLPRLQGTMANAPEVMNIRQASEYLGVSADTLYKYVYEEKIPAFKLGNRWKFKKTILDQWMERKSTEGEERENKKSKAARAGSSDL